MANTKLLKVMDYLINEQEDKAKELLHQIFIEKARAIHEEMMRNDEDMDEADLGGDMGEDLTNKIKAHEVEIEGEEHYSPMEAVDDDADMDMEDAEEDLSDELEDASDDEHMSMDDEDDVDADDDVDVSMDDDAEVVDDEDHSEDEKIHDLEQAIAELQAEFKALKHSNMDSDHDAVDADRVSEAWEDPTDDLAEDYDGLDENIDLETVQAARSGEVGSGKFAPAETNKHSPVPPTQTDVMGARAVKTGIGAKASGYDRQRAPDSNSMGLSNRRKDADIGKHSVSKEGDSSALLNKGTSNGFGAVNTKSPIRGNK